jgi:EAL domain-containing protein (putative c-di-GMP-specific phosphodiesterase class I)
MFLPQSNKDQTIVDATITMAKSLNLSVVAEGIEDLATLNMLKELGCDKAQGFYLAKPMALDSYLDWLKTYRFPLS